MNYSCTCQSGFILFCRMHRVEHKSFLEKQSVFALPNKRYIAPKVRPVDMFPYTEHVETEVLFENITISKERAHDEKVSDQLW